MHAVWHVDGVYEREYTGHTYMYSIQLLPADDLKQRKNFKKKILVHEGGSSNLASMHAYHVQVFRRP